MDESKQRKLGAVLSYVSIIVTTLIQLLYTPLLIRKLGQNEYGLYSLISSVIGYLTILDLGFGNAIVVYSSKYRTQQKYDEEKRLLGMFKIIFLIIGAIAGILGLILFLMVPKMFGATMSSAELLKAKIMMLILALNLVFTFSFNLYSAIIGSYEKFVFQKLIAILSTILKPIIMIPLLFMGFKSISLTVVITVLNILVCLSNYIYCRKKLNVKAKFIGFDKVLFKTILGYSIWLFLGAIVDKINWSVDQFVLGAVSGTIAVSIYSVAAHLNTLFINLSTAISGVLLPKVTKMIAKDCDSSELTNEFIKVGRIQYYVIFLMCFGLIFVGKEFILLWAGKGFEESYYVALLLIIPLCFPLIQNLGLSIMQAMNKFKFKSISTFIMAIFNIIISIFLAKAFGPIGCAFGTALALIICNIIIVNIYYYKVIKLDVIKFWKSILKMTFTLIIPVIIEIIIIYFTKFKGVKNILIYGSTFTILYCLTAYFITMNNYEKNLINSFINKIFLRKNKKIEG